MRRRLAKKICNHPNCYSRGKIGKAMRKMGFKVLTWEHHICVLKEQWLGDLRNMMEVQTMQGATK